MYWDDLNKDNIEDVKELYLEYLEDNKKDKYISNLMDFETFMQSKLVKCDRCGKVILDDNYIGLNKDNYYYLCECCHDDLYELPDNSDDERDAYNEMVGE